jgi:hypothetical protein
LPNVVRVTTGAPAATTSRHALECRAHDIASCPNFRAHVQDIVDGKGAQGPTVAALLSGRGRQAGHPQHVPSS